MTNLWSNDMSPDGTIHVSIGDNLGRIDTHPLNTNPSCPPACSIDVIHIYFEVLSFELVASLSPVSAFGNFKLISLISLS